MAAQPPHDEERFEHFLGSLLRVGVLIAAAVVIVGGVIYLTRHGHETPDYHTFHEQPSPLYNPRGIVEWALAFRGRGIIQLGLLLLIATPVARVVFSALGFARERDWTYVAFTLFVLAVLLYSLFFESAEGP
jgi:uncharacterized membrane protein